MEQGHVESRQSCAARMLDLRSYIIAARKAMNVNEPAAVVAMIVVFGFIGLCLLPIWIGFDLASTWAWSTGTVQGTSDATSAIASHIDSIAPAGATLANMTMGQVAAALIVVGITMLPTLFELAFPSVQHPLLMSALNVAIMFDYITDWQSSWAATAGWGAADNWFAHFLWTAVWNLFISVGVQAILVVCVTVVVYGFIRLMQGAPRAVEAVVISNR